MAALTCQAIWSADDDRLLKNAVEDGASLESLAKGAVPFSRQFTLQELRERWHALLYDLDTASIASARIIELDIELSASSPSKARKTCGSGGKFDSNRRKQGGSVRSHYYSMRERVRKYCHSAEVDFLVPHSSCNGTNASYGYGQQFECPNEEHYNNFAEAENMPEYHNHFEMKFESRQHVFPDVLRVDSAASNGNASHDMYDGGLMGSIGEDFLDEFGYTEYISPESLDEARGSSMGQRFDHDCEPGHLVDTCSDVQETKPPHILPTSNLYENGNSEAQPISGFDPTYANHGTLSADFVENQNLISQIPEDMGSFHHLEYSSVPPDVSMWTSFEDIPDPDIGVGGYLEDKRQSVFNIDDIMTMGSDDDGSSDLMLNNGISSAGLNNPTDIPDDNFVDFPGSFVDFGNNAELGTNLNAEDIDDMSFADHLNSILSCDSDAHQEDMPNLNDPRISDVPKSCFAIPDTINSVDSNNPCNQMHSGNDNSHNICVSDINIPSSKTFHTGEPQAEFLTCTFNTEDREVPCNDDVVLLPPSLVLPPFPSSDLKHSFGVNTFATVAKSEGKNITTATEEAVAVDQPLTLSTKAGLSVLPEVGATYSSNTSIVKHESIQNLATAVDLQSTPAVAFEEARNTSTMRKHGNQNISLNSILDKPSQVSNNTNIYSINREDNGIQDADTQVTVKDDVTSDAEMLAIDTSSLNPDGNITTSNQEEQSIDSEDDLPNFFDVESMILNMDLGVYDNKSSFLDKNSTRNQSVGTKKTIMRLEQGARSYMNKIISSHGAFAFFYGFHLKYFMKESKVTLGRETEEYKVDIDLGREGLANKISRVQATIKLKDDGSFVLKNHGKIPIFVNDKEVHRKRCVRLSSSSLIEIKNMRFMFEINETAARNHINHTARNRNNETHIGCPNS